MRLWVSGWRCARAVSVRMPSTLLEHATAGANASLGTEAPRGAVTYEIDACDLYMRRADDNAGNFNDKCAWLADQPSTGSLKCALPLPM